MVNFSPTNSWDRLVSLGHPQQISTGFACWLRYCTDVTQWRSTKLCTMFGRLLGWYSATPCGHIHFRGSFLLTEFSLRLAFSYIAYWQRYCTAFQQPNFAAWYKEWNYGTFDPRHFQHRGPPIFQGRLGGQDVGHNPTFWFILGCVESCKNKKTKNSITGRLNNI